MDNFLQIFASTQIFMSNAKKYLTSLNKIQIALPNMAVYPWRVNYPSSGTTALDSLSVELYCKL